MSFICKGVCDTKLTKFKKPPRKEHITGGHYTYGYRFCSICDGYFYTSARKCDCCHADMRSRPHNIDAAKKPAMLQMIMSWTPLMYKKGDKVV